MKSTKHLPKSKRKRRYEIPNKYFRRMIRQAEKNWREGNTSPAFDNIKDNLEWLEKQGI